MTMGATCGTSAMPVPPIIDDMKAQADFFTESAASW